MSDPAVRPLAVDHRGNALTSFDRAEEGSLQSDASLPLALTALWHGTRVLMVFDRFRESGELPGGRIESGETPAQAALRELREETGQEPDGPLRFVGYARFELAPGRRVEYGALFTGRTRVRRGFRGNDEISAVHWWDSREAPPRPVPPVDAYLAQLTQERCPE